MADGAIRDVLERSIDELPDDLRIVLVACVVDGMTPGQFAELSALTSERISPRESGWIEFSGTTGLMTSFARRRY